ncbi:MAG: hypothetical protein H8M99_14205 [Gloeobacteraceae cyanobacterium ES-bin-144]|nr:hypothetical protein [Verrucomicrobiales bacterium]
MSNLNARIEINPDFLVEHVPPLRAAKRNRHSWEEFGETIDRNIPRNALLLVDSDEESKIQPTTESLWKHAKEWVYEIIVHENPKYHRVCRELNSLEHISTPALLSSLSMRLSGELKIPLSAAQSMVAAILYGVFTAAGDWEILHSS